MGIYSRDSFFDLANKTFVTVNKKLGLMRVLSEIKEEYKINGYWSVDLINKRKELEERIADIAYFNYSQSSPDGAESLNTEEQRKFLADFKKLLPKYPSIKIKIQGKNEEDIYKLTDKEILDGDAYRILPNDYRARANHQSMLMSRLTINVKKEYYVDLANALMSLYEKDPDKKIMQSKIMGAKELGVLTDQSVIYFSRADLEYAIDVCQKIKLQLPEGAMIEHVPMGMHRIDKGFSYSETLEGQSSSHGESRSVMISTAIFNSLFHEKPLDDYLTKELIINGYDTDNPALLSGKIKIQNNIDDESLPGTSSKIASNQDSNIFKSNPVGFARQYAINTDNLKDINAYYSPDISFILIKTSPSEYNIEYADNSYNSLQLDNVIGYFLRRKKDIKSTKFVDYIDIPKSNPKSLFLFTGSLNGDSLIVSDLNEGTYRVYRDKRPNASLLYDNVVMAIDSKDYNIRGVNTDKANAFMFFDSNEWNLIFQITKDKKINEFNEYYVEIKKNGSYQYSEKLRQFNELREKNHFRLKLLAKKMNVVIDAIPQSFYESDGVIVDDTWLKIAERIKEKTELQLKEFLNKRRGLEIELKKSSDVKHRNKIKNALEMNETLFLIKKDEYERFFKEVIETENSFILQRIKEKKGMSTIIKIDEFSGNYPFQESTHYLTVDERYENLIYLHRSTRNFNFKENFNEGYKEYSIVSIDGFEYQFTSNQLKKLYISKELTARERGALYRRIQESVHVEFISSILSQTGKVSEIFKKNGSQINRLIPQDFYLSLVKSNSGGRCYPLVRSMSVALAMGGMNSADNLINKLYISAASPESINTRLLKSSLGQLHSNTDAILASTSYGIVNLKKTKSYLDHEAETTMFSLNTRSHAMLIGKTVVQNKITYYFYDPNFGLFSFDDSKKLFSALKKFFVDKDMSTYYSAFEIENNPAFELVLINTDKMGSVSVGNNLTVDDLNSLEELDVLQKNNKKIDSLVVMYESIESDLQLKSSLVILDAEHWGERLNQSTLKLMNENQLDDQWIPVFSDIERIDNDKYRLKFINRENIELISWLETNDHVFDDFHQYSIRNMEFFNEYYRFENDDISINTNDLENVSIDGLNSGIAIQTIIQWSKYRTNNTGENENAPNLSLALKIHTYVNYAMMAHGTVNDVSKISALIRMELKINGEFTAEETSIFFSSLAKTANESIGVIFCGAMVGFDAYELTNAENDSERIIFGTQLAFDSASLASTMGGIGFSAAGYTSTAAVFGGSGVIIAGLGIGFAGLARNFAIIGEDAKSVGRYFYALDEAYQDNGYDFIVDKKLLKPKFGAVFNSLDLRNNKIQFDSQYIYRTSPRSSGGGRHNYIFWAGNFPTMVKDREQAINIRQGIGYQSARHQLDFSHADAIMLPVIPKSYIKYNYNLWPGCTSRHDNGFDVIRRLEQGDNFDYDFYIFPSVNTITQIFHEYVDTSIDVVLDENNRELVIPQLAKEWHGKIEYKIKGYGGTYKLNLNNGIRISLTDDVQNNQNSKWVIDASQLEDCTVKILNNQLMVGNIKINVDIDSVQGQIIVVDKNKEMREVDFSAAQVAILSEDEKLWQGTPKSLDQHLQHYAKKHKAHGQYITIDNHQHNGKDVGRAFYDVSKQRYIFIDTLDANKQHAILSTVVDDTAYFYLPVQKQIWEVDIATGVVSAEYQLENQNNRPFEILQLWKGDGHIYFSCKYTDSNEVVNFQLEQNIIKLIGLNANPALLEQLAQTPTQFSTITPQRLLQNYMLKGTHKPDAKQSVQIEADLGQSVTISGIDSNQALHRYWLRVADRLLIKPNLSPSLGYGEEPTNIRLHQSHWAIPPDLALMGSLFDDKGTEIFYFYSHKNKELYRQEGAGQNILNVIKPTAQFLNTPHNLQNVVFWQGSLFMSDSDGVVCQIDASGKYHPVALNEIWLKGRVNWWEKLGDYYCCKPITLIGLNKENSQRAIPAWYLNRKVIIAHELSLENNIQLLGLSTDNSAGLIFDPIAKKLYSQPFAMESQLSSAFGQGQHLISGAQLPKVVDVYPNLRLDNVKIVGNGLLMFAESGEILYVDILANENQSQSAHIGSSLIIRGGKQNDRLSPAIIQDVENIVLSAGDGQDTYRISKEAWAYYHSIIIDNHALDSQLDTLILPVSESDELVMSQHDDDLFITDMSQNTTLVLRQVFGDQKQAHQHLQLRFINQTKDVSLEQFIQRHSLDLTIDLAETHIELKDYQRIESDVHFSLLSEQAAGFAQKDSLGMPRMDTQWLPSMTLHNGLLGHPSQG